MLMYVSISDLYKLSVSHTYNTDVKILMRYHVTKKKPIQTIFGIT